MEIDSQTGLVLEGGGMRAIFTVGVLDYFMDHDICCIAVFCGCIGGRE